MERKRGRQREGTPKALKPTNSPKTPQLPKPQTTLKHQKP